MPLPILRTPRLTLRPFSLADIDELYALWTTAEVRRFLWDDVVIPRERAEEVVRAQIACAEAEGIGCWLLLDRETMTHVGFAGLIRLNDDMEPELLYGLAPEWWGRGLATEAAYAVARYAFDTLGFTRLRAATDVPNAASVRVMERLGMRFMCRGTLNGLDTLFYEVRRDEFVSAPNTARR